MSFREKVAWIALVTTLAAWSCYFTLLAYLYRRDGPDAALWVGLFAAVVVTQMVITAIAITVTAIRAPADARAPRDERDRAIERRSGAIAYQALIVAVGCVAIGMNFGLRALGMANGIIGAIALGEMVRYGAQVAGYLGSRHG